MRLSRNSLLVDLPLAALLGLASLLYAAWVFHYDQVSTRIPTAYSGDGLYYAALIKGVIENGWYLHNPLLGAPFGLDMGPFPMSDNMHFAMLWLIGQFAGDFASTMSWFYLASFATAAFSAFLAMRWIGMHRLFAASGAVLFSLQHFHFARGGHLFLAS